MISCTGLGPYQKDSAITNASLPAPVIPLLEGDSLDLERLGNERLETFLCYPGMAVGDRIWPRFFGCGANGEIFDRPPTPVTIEKLESDGSFLVTLDNDLLRSLDKGVAFYSYAKDIGTEAPGYHLEETSMRLFFYINKPVDSSVLLAPPHFMESDGLVIDLERVPGDGQVITAAYPFMLENDKVVLSWKDTFYSEQFTKQLKDEDLGKPLVWRIDSAFLQLAGEWCELSYTIEYAGGRKSESPSQRFTIVGRGAGQSPSLPAPKVPDHSGDILDPNQYREGLPVVVDDYGVQYGDELLLTAQGAQTSRSMLRVDRSIQDSGRLAFTVPDEWLQAHLGDRVRVTWQWTRQGAAADSAPLELTLSRPLDLKGPFIEDATPKDPDPDESFDPDIKDFGFIYPDRLREGAYARIPVESETGDGKITLYWEGFGEKGKYETSTPVVGNTHRFQIPSTAVPANFDRRVKIFYTVEDSAGITHISPAYGLRIEPLTSSSFEAVQCPAFPNGAISLAAVKDEVIFYLSSRSWHFFDQGQEVLVYVRGHAEPPVPDKVIRDRTTISKEEWLADQLLMKLDKTYLEGLTLHSALNIYVEVSFDGGYSFIPGRSAEFRVEP